MIEVTKLKYLGGYRLHATFSDGTAGEHDFSALVARPGPMGVPLRDPAYFARVFLEYGAPTWPNGFDVCPDWLRREIEATSGLVWDGVAQAVIAGLDRQSAETKRLAKARRF